MKTKQLLFWIGVILIAFALLRGLAVIIGFDIPFIAVVGIVLIWLSRRKKG